MEPKNNNSFLSLSSDEEESNEEELSNKIIANNINEEKINPKNDNNIFNGISKESLNNKIDENNSDKEYILKLRIKLNNNIAKTRNKKMLILPPPENELEDKQLKENNFQDDDLENKGYIKLMNPDNINFNTKETILSNNINNDKNIISINQKDILEENWEIKYINTMLKKDMKEAFKNEEDKEDNSKMNNKKRKRGKNKDDDDELNEDRARSKYDKISTKKKYGW